ncbi:hypothetical protein FIBSPDRAFT_927496 [Athelia psychrophila]|uniref:Uncharacterized protein n=1 Tax=Athelia psychrophila TaxID=1759441 RepID=A0A166RWX4_9AGAM|nr:hypothetical protein FIBSPDRAFT_927496 [Fibularhizoctonia sp. CBS 109695]
MTAMLPSDFSPWPLFPLARTYVVFSIDSIATLASLNDAEVIAAASTLPSGQYVGYVADVETSSHYGEGDAAFTTLLRIELLRRQHHSVHPSEQAGQDASAGSSTTPIRTRETSTASLLWPGFFHSPECTINIRVMRRHADASRAARLRPPFASKRAKSLKRRATATHVAAHPGVTTPNLKPPRRHSSMSYAPGVQTEVESLAREGNFLGKTLSSLVAEEGIPDIVSIVYCNSDPSEETCMPLATWMTYDMNSVTEPLDPEHCLEECRALRRLEEEHYARAKANIAAAIVQARMREAQESQPGCQKSVKRRMSVRISQSSRAIAARSSDLSLTAFEALNLKARTGSVFTYIDLG